MNKLLAILILLITSIASADSKILGHMTPLDSELLDSPISLDCGATVKEYRNDNGKNISKSDINTVNKLCTNTKRNFITFVKSKGYKINSSSFRYNISLIPVGSEYRELNDNTYRFSKRDGFPGEISGYTSHNNKYVFSLSNPDPANSCNGMSEFEISLVHELFHAMSHHYKVLKQHPSNNLEGKKRYDEVLAQEFTMKYLRCR